MQRRRPINNVKNSTIRPVRQAPVVVTDKMRQYNGPKEKTAQPIKSKQMLERICENLQSHNRNYALFVIGVETAFRAGDILNIRLQDVRGLQVGDNFTIREGKTGKKRTISVNERVFNALQPLLQERKAASRDDFLFVGEKRGTRMTVETFGRYVKQWCKDVGLDEPGYSAHTLRKTFGFMNRMNGAPIELLQNIYGHSSSKITQTYIAIQPEEVKAVYDRGVL